MRTWTILAVALLVAVACSYDTSYTTSSVPITRGDVDGAAESWLIWEGADVAEALAEETVRRGIPIGAETRIAAQRVEATLSITVGAWNRQDMDSIPAVVTFDAVFHEAGGLVLTGELPVILSMDIPAGKVSSDPDYSEAELCFGWEAVGVSSETCVGAEDAH